DGMRVFVSAVEGGCLTPEVAAFILYHEDDINPLRAHLLPIFISRLGTAAGPESALAIAAIDELAGSVFAHSDPSLSDAANAAILRAAPAIVASENEQA